ncbi:RimK family alpha-L-glutamate ligase [Sporolactobacillus sp. CPB3-1]|uniref:RimK family alpha-L-glutamate ligase n=1 Tax=Sporolactobacillus mangiferae TaxID=2940498 RepID=A0ABT0M9L2_9BACL|nr:RimK family alpha-L-glutamate ligase [Sporolactobacillus mangiferae]MCL1631560.1 RimK family alpha-L-glutamate ligase [Sporolactobacillus mangiferae]
MAYGWMIYSKSVLHNKYGNNAFEWMVDTAAAHDIHLAIIFAEDLAVCMDLSITFIYKNKSLNLPDFVLMRCYNRILGMQLEALGIRVINTTEAMFRSRNKVITSQMLNKAGIRTPKTLYTGQHDYHLISTAFDRRPFVMKAVEGSQGTNVCLIKNESDFDKAFRQTNGFFLCQEYIEESSGRDLRIYVLGGRVLGSVLRTAKTGFRANYALGGRAESYETTKAIEAISIQAAQALQLEFCGVDLLFGKDGLTVCEMNGNAGFRTLSKVSDVDIAEELFNYVDAQIYAN